MTGYHQFLKMLSYHSWVPRVVFEIGVGSSLDICRSHCFWRYGSQCLLFEPNLESFQTIEKEARNYHTVKVHPFAISDKNGEEELFVNGDNSVLCNTSSPAGEKQQKNLPKIKVITKTIDMFDNGDIDLLLIDTEGEEYSVLKFLKSRPNFIIIETHNYAGNGVFHYVHKYINEIKNWFETNNYKLVFTDFSDSFYILK